MVSLSYISDLTKPRRRRQRERQNTIILMSKTTTLHVHHAFLYISLPSLRNYDVKWPNFKFTWEWKRQGDKFYHLCPNLSAFPSLQLQPLSDREVPIKELWQRRRQRGHKKRRTLHVITLFCTFLCTTTTWKPLTSHFMEDINKRRRIFLPLSKLKCGPQQINSREIPLTFHIFSESPSKTNTFGAGSKCPS